MTQDNRCENCGRKLPCEPCGARARQALEDSLLDRLEEMVTDAHTLILWFRLPEDAAWQHLNRLAAEWPGALEVIMPIEPGDTLGCRVAFNEEDLGKNPTAEWEVTETRVALIDNGPFFQAILAMGPPPWG